MTQLDRIEAKLNWLRWRMRWGEMKLYVDEITKLTSGLMPEDIGPDPGWPEETT